MLVSALRAVLSTPLCSLGKSVVYNPDVTANKGVTLRFVAPVNKSFIFIKAIFCWYWCWYNFPVKILQVIESKYGFFSVPIPGGQPTLMSASARPQPLTGERTYCFQIIDLPSRLPIIAALQLGFNCHRHIDLLSRAVCLAPRVRSDSREHVGKL